MRSPFFLLLLTLAATVALTVVSAQAASGRICPLGGKPPAECPNNNHWDQESCRWICNADVKCVVDPCQIAAKNNICPFKNCVADFSKGCDFKCSKCSRTCATTKCPGGTKCVQDAKCDIECKPLTTPKPTSKPTPTPTSGPNVCIQGGAPPKECSREGAHYWDSKTCKWICNRPVNCLIDPCDNAVRDGKCSRELCTADYWTGCNYACNGVFVDPSVTVTCTSNEGNPVAVGEGYRGQCNYCTCQADGGSTCTKMGCFGTCFDDNGKGYQVGEKRAKDCNTCTCTKNGWACTEKFCPVPTGRVCIQGGPVPAECPTTYIWDSKTCKFVCQKPPTTCKTSCAATLCRIGTICEQDQSCNVKCTPQPDLPVPEEPKMCIQGGPVPTECPTTYIWDSKACKFVCQQPPATCPTSCAATTCLTGTVCEQDQSCNVQCTPLPEEPVPEEPTICIQGGEVPPECPTTNVWDSKACKWVCQAPPATCPKNPTCASTTCLTGTVCEQDQNCKVKCTPIQCTDKCPLVRCQNGPCVMNYKTCTPECGTQCPKDLCPLTDCPTSRSSCRMNAACEAECYAEPSGVVVLSATFSVTKKTSVKKDVYDAMRKVGTDAGKDVLRALLINIDNISRIKTNTWSVQIGITGDSESIRQSLLSRYIAQLARANMNYARLAGNDEEEAGAADVAVDSTEQVSTSEAMMMMQSCPDGSQISAADECAVDALVVPDAASSSSSTPLVAIVVPIVAGVVLLAVIATVAVVIIRRRRNTIKTMTTNVQQETQMAQRV